MADQNKSEAIRKVLEAVPDIRSDQARAILAKEGIAITPDLFRVVKKKWLRDRREQDEAERRYKEYWSPEAVQDRAEANQRHWARRRSREKELVQMYLSRFPDRPNGGPPLPAPMQPPPANGPPLPPDDGFPPPPEPAPPPEEGRRLTAQQKDDLVAEVVRAFSPEEWAEIVADSRKPGVAEASIAEELMILYDDGLTTSDAVTRLIARFRGVPTTREEDFGEDDRFWGREA